MKCTLCKKNIDRYTPAFNHLSIDDDHSIDICQSCIDTFIKWQGDKFAALFPTKTMKRRYEKKKK